MKNIQLIFLVIFWGGCANVFAGCFSYIPETAPDSAFNVHGNGLVTDTRTGLMWRKCTEGQSGDECSGKSVTSYTWKEALQHVKTVNSNSADAYSDWRLPNKKELESIIANNCVFPSINVNIFSMFGAGDAYWSSTSYAGSADSAWLVSFWYGKMEPKYKTGKNFIRLVRGGG